MGFFVSIKFKEHKNYSVIRKKKPGWLCTDWAQGAWTRDALFGPDQGPARWTSEQGEDLHH